MEEQFQGFEEEYPYDNKDNNTNSNGLLQPVIPGTNLPIQTEDVVMAREPENLPCSGPDISFMEETKVVESTVLIGPFSTGLEEDPHSPTTHIPAPPSNYQTKVTDPTGQGGKEVEVDPILERLDNFHVHNQSTPTVDQAIKSEPTVLIGQSTPTEYRHKAAEMLAPVYEKVADVGSAVLSKLRPGEDDKALSEAIFGKKEDDVAGKRSLQQGVMDRLKSAVGSSSSWLGKSRSDEGTIVVEEEVTMNRLADN